MAPMAHCELDNGPALSADTARRLSCDASLVPMLNGPKGALDVGRKTRAIPPSLRRALDARDHGCQFPGCNNREWVDAHHITHWARGGETKLDNLVLLCGHHHRLVHEGGFGVSRRVDGALAFHRPDGRVIPAVPSPTRGRCGEVRARNRLAGLTDRGGDRDAAGAGRADGSGSGRGGVAGARLDVQPHVAQAERLVFFGEHVGDEWGAELLGQPVELGAEADRSHELGRLRGDDVPGLQPAANVVEARPLEPLRSSPLPRRSSRAARSRRGGRGMARGRRPPRRRPAGSRCCRRRRTGPPAPRRASALAAGCGRARRGRGSSGRRRWRRRRPPARRAPARSGRRPCASSTGRRTERTASTIEGEPSTATTRPRGSRSISIPVTRPLPQPASSTTSSPLSSSRSRIDCAHSWCGTETRW